MVLELIRLVEVDVGPAVGPDQLQLAVELVVTLAAAVHLFAEPSKIK